MKNFKIKIFRKKFYLKKYFRNVKKALIAYKNKKLEIHSYIWINNETKNLKEIKIIKKLKRKKIRKFIVSIIKRFT